MSKRKSTIAPATVIAVAALFIALAAPPAAFALGKASVGPWHLKWHAVTTPKIDKGAVTTGKIRNKAVRNAKVKPHSLGSDRIRKRAPGLVLATVRVDSRGDVLNGFNRLGARPTAERTDTGTYLVTVPGASLGSDSIQHISAQFTDVICRGFPGDGRANQIGVACRHDGSPDSTTFNLTLVAE